jgi:hypothetical protein
MCTIRQRTVVSMKSRGSSRYSQWLPRAHCGHCRTLGASEEADASVTGGRLWRIAVVESRCPKLPKRYHFLAIWEPVSSNSSTGNSCLPVASEATLGDKRRSQILRKGAETSATRKCPRLRVSPHNIAAIRRNTLSNYKAGGVRREIDVSGGNLVRFRRTTDRKRF